MIKKLLSLIILIFFINSDLYSQCSTASTLPCATTLNGTTVGSTSATHGTGCLISDYGAWYTFVGDGQQTTISSTGTGGFDHEMAIASGNCGSLTNIACQDVGLSNGTESYTFTTTIGVNYYVYIANWSSGSSTTGTFTISRSCSTGPPPVTNDDPCNAINLTVGATCTYTTFTNAGATGTTGVPTPGCGSYSGGDVWFTVTVPASGNVIIDSNTGVITDSGMAVYSVTTPCPTLTLGLVECDDDDSTNGTMSSITLTGRPPGEVLYIRFWEYGNNNNGTFGICVTEPPAPQGNDDPCGAVSLTVNSDLSCTNTTSSTVVGATNSGINACLGTENNDVWFSFVATNTSHYIDLLNITGSTTDLVHAVYGGFTAPDCSVAVGDNISCSDPNSSSIGGLTVGQTYFVQVYTYFSGSATTTFDICIGTPPPGSGNDDPCGAVGLTANSTCIGTTGTVASATNSGIDSCFGTPDNDVWYSFIATNSSQTVSLFNVVGSTTDMYHAVYGPFTSPDCSVAVADNISCNDADSTDLTGLTVGATYFVQVFTYFSGPETTSFEICVTEPCSNTDPISTYPTLCPTTIIDEQGNNPFDANPFILDPTVNLDCSFPTVTLEVNSNLKETSSYIVEQITYPSPAPDYDFPILGTGNNQSISTDDYWADSRTNLGFNFCFYENSYTQTLVGPNGIITFDNSIAAGDYAGYSFSNNLPSTAGALFEQAIYGVYHDIIPTNLPVDAIKSRTIGTAPCRQFQVSWHDIPMFSDNTRLYTGMIVLHETTNIIEVFIEEKRIENGNVNPWNGGNAIVGIQGDITPLSPNNQYAVAPCRNGLDTNWETTNEAWRFTPNGAVITPNNVTWYSASNGGIGGTSIGSGSTINVSIADTYYAVSNYPTCSGVVQLTDEIIVNQSSKTWMGYTNNNWYEATNWEPNGVPTEFDCVLIPDANISNIEPPIADESYFTPPTPPVPAYALNLTVAPTANIEIASNTRLVVTDWIHLDGTIDIRDSGSLIQITDGTANINNNTGNGAINMQRTTTIASPYDYIYWSTPVEGFNVTNVSPGSSLIYQWIPTIPGNGTGNHGNWQATTENMINGKGYIIRNIAGTPTPSTPEFIGRPNNGVITKTITRGNYNGIDYTGGGTTVATRQDDNWNLIGNPYPSAISANSFITENAVTNNIITGTVYLWRHLDTPSDIINDPFYDGFVYNYNPNDYITHNGTGSNPAGFNGNIAAGQAFFVLMEHTASTPSNIIFNNTMRSETLDNSQFYRMNESSENSLEIEKHRIWLDLIAPDNHANSILVGYVENATNDIDGIFDAHDLSKTSTRFYSLINEEKMSIQGRSLPFDENDIVPLGLVIPQDGNYTIAINLVDGLFDNSNQDIFLEDTYTNVIHDLRNAPYSFNADVGTFNNRFILRYTNNALSITEENLLNDLHISAPNNSYIKVTSKLETINSVSVYDVLGRILVNNPNINKNEMILNNISFSNGTYIVKVTLNNGLQKTQKVILK